MNQIKRDLCISFQIDTNRINARNNLKSMNQLEKWRDDEVILIGMSEVAQQEATAGHNTKRVDKALNYIYTKTLPSTSNEQELLRRIENILFPEGVTNQNQKNDIDIVFNARKYGSILITAEGNSASQPGGMLGHKENLKALGIDIMSDHEAVALVKSKIQRRDDIAIRRHNKYGLPLPSWVSKD